MERRTHPEPDEAGIDRKLARLASASAVERFATGFENRVMARIAVERTSPSRAPSAVIRPIRLVAAAAAVVVLLSAGLAIDGARWRAVTVPAGTSLAVGLPDGSRITLQAGSTLRRRPFRFRAERRVRLEGEAFLEVAASDRPFVVQTFNADVVVTGTRFNVRAWPDDTAPETAVALVEGSVTVRSRGAEPQAMTLQAASPSRVAIAAGETARVAGGTAARVDDAPDPADASNWTAGGLAFRDRPLADVLRALQRRYDVRIEADEALTRGRTATYLNPEAPELVDVLDALSFALGLRYGRTANGWALTAAGDPAP